MATSVLRNIEAYTVVPSPLFAPLSPERRVPCVLGSRHATPFAHCQELTMAQKNPWKEQDLCLFLSKML